MNTYLFHKHNVTGTSKDIQYALEIDHEENNKVIENQFRKDMKELDYSHELNMKNATAKNEREYQHQVAQDKIELIKEEGKNNNRYKELENDAQKDRYRFEENMEKIKNDGKKEMKILENQSQQNGYQHEANILKIKNEHDISIRQLDNQRNNDNKESEIKMKNLIIESEDKKDVRKKEILKLNHDFELKQYKEKNKYLLSKQKLDLKFGEMKNERIKIRYDNKMKLEQEKKEREKIIAEREKLKSQNNMKKEEMRIENEKYKKEMELELENNKENARKELDKMKLDNKLEEKKIDNDFNKYLIEFSSKNKDKDVQELIKIIAGQNNQKNCEEKKDYEKSNINPQLYLNNFMPQGYFPQMQMPYMPQYFMSGFPFGMNMCMYPQQQMAFQGQVTPDGLSKTNPNIQPMNNNNMNSSCPNTQIN